jgi:hypothetical protein
VLYSSVNNRAVAEVKKLKILNLMRKSSNFSALMALMK